MAAWPGEELEDRAAEIAAAAWVLLRQPSAWRHRRVETITPIRDPEIFAHVRDVVLSAYLRDNKRAMLLDSAGHYDRPAPTDEPFDSQQFLLQHYTDKTE